MEPIVTIKVRLLEKQSGQPLTSDGIIVKLYDKDILEDDFLGQSNVDSNGNAEISFKKSEISSADSPGEKFPDLYFTVFKFGKLLYQSKILNDFDIDRFSSIDPVKGRTIDLGTFVIE
jgi:hypothetical protein